MNRITFTVHGTPVPKQSFRFKSGGHSFQPAHLRSWQDLVSWQALEALRSAQFDTTSSFPLKDTAVQVKLDFFLPNKRKRDLDNLSKAILDGCNKTVWEDDTQVWYLRLRKYIDRDNPRVIVEIDWD